MTTIEVYNTQLFNGGPLVGYHLFSQGKYLGPLNQENHGKILRSSSIEYNHAFIWHKEAKDGQNHWWRADGTPYPKEQVPKVYLAMALLL
jgi:hypothetical protein